MLINYTLSKQTHLHLRTLWKTKKKSLFLVEIYIFFFLVFLLHFDEFSILIGQNVIANNLHDHHNIASRSKVEHRSSSSIYGVGSVP